jgi:Sulfotransferase domain
MMLPNFLVIGAIKSGTTSLHRYLRSHAQVFTSKKEPEFFASRVNKGNWDRGLRWYEELFADAGDALAVGEVSISYTQYPLVEGVPARIAQVLPDVRLIYLVRHPIDRIVSHFWMRIRKGRETETSIDKAVRANPGYLDISRYAMQVERYLEYFPLERILIVKSEDLRAEREPTLREIFAFLGADPDRMPDGLKREYGRGEESRRRRRPIDFALRRVPAYDVLARVSPAPLKRLKRELTTEQTVSRPILPDSLRQELEEKLRDDVRQLRHYIRGDFDGWGIA